MSSRRWMLALLAGLLLATGPAPRAAETEAPGAAVENAFDWTVGSWKGLRRDGKDGSEAPITIRVEPILGGVGQIRHLEARPGGGVYRGLAVQVFDRQLGRWVRQYVYEARGRFARLEGEVAGGRSVWRSVSQEGARRSRLESESLADDRWRRTMSVSIDGGETWQVLWIDELRRAPEAATSEARCRPIAGVDSVLERNRILLLGELHGTAEAPAFVAELACHATASGRSVTVALEIVGSERARLEAYLASAGSAADREALLAGAPWRNRVQYGVTSEAMLALVESLRRLREQGHPIDVALFNRTDGASSRERDRLMSEALGTLIEAAKSTLFLVLTGNIHSRLAPGTRFDPEYEPMGYLLRKAHPDWDLLSLDLAHSGGEAWICTGGRAEDCGARSQRPRRPAEIQGLSVTVNKEIQPYGHHGTYHVGTIHASPPAVR